MRQITLQYPNPVTIVRYIVNALELFKSVKADI